MPPLVLTAKDTHLGIVISVEIHGGHMIQGNRMTCTGMFQLELSPQIPAL